MKTIPPGSTIGILGGGQLGRMTAMAAARLGYHCHLFCPGMASARFLSGRKNIEIVFGCSR